MAKICGLVCLVLVCMVVIAPHAKAVISCGQVASYLGPCIPYVTKGGTIPPGCCSGIASLNNAAQTPADRKAACSCLKSLAQSLGKAIQPGLAAGLPSKCGVSVPYPISPNTDCSNTSIVLFIDTMLYLVKSMLILSISQEDTTAILGESMPSFSHTRRTSPHDFDFSLSPSAFRFRLWTFDFQTYIGSSALNLLACFCTSVTSLITKSGHKRRIAVVLLQFRSSVRYKQRSMLVESPPTGILGFLRNLDNHV
ncbi:hypothetical protein ACH5RR_007203 [Cinchona calisaya]|uniref:Non-specific lipid-transfer protein n=1 Tax=Cinchona calisaya TaxID=153742 RepID=A0ABD3ARL1_9GENT